MTATTRAQDGLRIFISYRRSDCQPQANGLHDGLSHRLPSASVFMDLDSIPYGVDFEQHIRSEIEGCDVVLVLIGDNWLDVVDESGTRRIDQEGDFVRLEVENALANPEVKVIPVLVEGARMPSQSDLPETIRRLARINAIELSDRRWKADLERLAGVLEDIGAQAAAPSPEPAQLHAASIDAAVRAAYGPFQTRDIAQAPSVVAAHPALASTPHFEAAVGAHLTRSAAALGIQLLGHGPDGRGQTWQRVAAPAPQYAVPHPPAGYAPVPPAYGGHHPGAPRSGTSTTAKVLLSLLSVVSVGFLAWIPCVWAWTRPHTPPVKKKVARLTAVAVATLIIGGVFFGIAPVDAEGTAEGPLPVIGFLFLLASMAAGVVAAVRYGDPQ